MIAMYNECLYELPPPERDHVDKDRTFIASRYVPQTLKSAVRSVIGKFKSESSDTEGDYDSRLKAQVIFIIC